MQASDVRRAAELLALMENLDDISATIHKNPAFRLQLCATNGEGEGGTEEGCAIVENFEQAKRILRMTRLDIQRELEELRVEMIPRAP